MRARGQQASISGLFQGSGTRRQASIQMNRQAITALFLLVLNTGYFVQALSLPRPFLHGEPGPAFVPFILSAILYLAAGRILYMAMRGIGDITRGDEPLEASTLIKPFALVLATAGFIYAFEPLGYWLATLLYTFVVAMLFEYERSSMLRALGVAALVALGVTVLGWLFFMALFDLFLPSGEVFR
jgi:putative tricarboxylic transport membrane protein